MPNTILKITVLAQQQEDHSYSVRPLFIPFPVVNSPRFEQAMELFRKRLTQLFQNFRLERDNLDHLMWYNFQHPFTFKRFHLRDVVGKQTVAGDFSVACFEVEGKWFLSFPGFGDFMAMRTGFPSGGIEEEAAGIVLKLLKKAHKEEGDDFNPALYMAARREFTAEVVQEVFIRENKFKFEREKEQSFFQFFRTHAQFTGIEELNKTGYLLNDLYPASLRRAYRREEFVGEMYKVLFEAAPTPIALIGPEGVGRHSIVEEALYRHLEAGKHPGQVQEKIWYMDPSRIITGMSIVGMWEKRLESILQYLVQTDKGRRRDKLLIDNPTALLQIGRSASNDLTMHQTLKPYLEKRSLQLILIATPEEWKLMQEKDRSFSDLFQVVRISPPSIEEAFQIVLERRKHLESIYDCQFTIQALMRMFAIYRNFFNAKALPGIVIKWMEQFAVKSSGRIIDAPDILAEFRGISGFEEALLDEGYLFEEGEAEKKIGRSLIGQESAVKALADSVQLIKARLNAPSKPLASYIFIGPTGVGKTQGAKVLAEFLMGNAQRIIRFDMNEYVDPFATTRLVGDFFNPEGQLINRIRYQPFGILLLDEIEKAHPGVHDLLLQVLDDGRLTDGHGRTVSFSNTIIIMTSNLGAREVSSRVGFLQEASDETAIYLTEIAKTFRPEFVNRIDRIVVFNPLRLEHIFEIARLQIQELLQRDGFVRRATMVNIEPQALEWVARRGFDSRMGGRALKRQIERDLTTLTAEQLIQSADDAPVLFDIMLEGEKLTPRITSLKFAPPLPEGWLPPTPAEAQSREYYEKLFIRIESMEWDLQDMSGDGWDWAFYQIKDRAAILKEKVKMALLDFSEYQLQRGPILPYRLKTSAQIWSNNRKNIEDYLFQKDGLNEINIRYQHGIARFDDAGSEYLQDYLDAFYLYLAQLSIQKNQLDKGSFKIESYQTGKGAEQIELLMGWYAQMLESLEVSCTVNKKNRTLEVEGYGLNEIFKSEEGIHLFFIAQETPLPLMTHWVPADKKAAQPKIHNTILRLYDENRTITDLRSGLTNAFQITPREMKVLVYAGLPAPLRKKWAPSGKT
jgi:ATP-dependent Clp protease ATP-binding subunit ClpC